MHIAASPYILDSTQYNANNPLPLSHTHNQYKK